MVKKLGIFILFIRLSAFSQDYNNIFSEGVRSYYYNFSENLATALNYLLIVPAITPISTPMPEYLWTKNEYTTFDRRFFWSKSSYRQLFSLNIGLTFNSITPFFKSSEFRDYDDTYSSPLNNLFTKNINLSSYNFGFKSSIRGNTPSLKPFIFTFGYNYIYSSLFNGFESYNTNFVNNVRFSEDGPNILTLSFILNKIEGGVDFVLVNEKYFNVQLGISYLFSAFEFAASGTSYETIFTADPTHLNLDVNTNILILGQYFFHSLAATPIFTFKANHWFQIYAGLFFSFIIDNQIDFQVNVSSHRQTVSALQYTVFFNPITLLDIFHTGILFGMHIHMVELGIRYNFSNPSLQAYFTLNFLF